MTDVRARIEAALAKPMQEDENCISCDEFDPWSDVITGIYGGYSSESDRVFIACLEALRDKRTFDFIKFEGFIGEFALYVLSGHDYVEYGTSPRGGWWDQSISDLLQPLIDKWKAYYEIMWGEKYE